jgi:short-subunit dehydrogenase
MHKILIVGATSAIAEATARIFAARGDALFLVARHADRLRAIAADLDLRGTSRVATATLDVADFSSHQAVIDAAERELGGLDIVLIAHGTLPDQGECEKSVDRLRREFDVNALATMSLLTLTANTFEQRRAGILAVISSVAGDRGRQSNYVYGAAKAAVSVFLCGLRQRLAKSDVAVLTIKPGFVDTPMTAAIANKGALWAKPDQIGAGIARAIDRRCDIVYLPWFWRPIMWVIRHIPLGVFKRIKL